MILKTEKKEVEIKLKIKDIIKLTKEYKSKNLHTIFFKSLIDGDLNFLTSLIQTFGYVEDEKALKTETEACDFIDSYITETQKSIEEIYSELAEVINESGFFIKKMSKEEMKVQMSGVLDIDTDKLMKDMIEKTLAEQMKPMIEQEFKGYKG